MEKTELGCTTALPMVPKIVNAAVVKKIYREAGSWKRIVNGCRRRSMVGRQSRSGEGGVV